MSPTKVSPLPVSAASNRIFRLEDTITHKLGGERYVQKVNAEVMVEENKY